MKLSNIETWYDETFRKLMDAADDNGLTYDTQKTFRVIASILTTTMKAIRDFNRDQE